jgi:hypothetical protein
VSKKKKEKKKRKFSVTGACFKVCVGCWLLWFALVCSPGERAQASLVVGMCSASDPYLRPCVCGTGGQVKSVFCFGSRSWLGSNGKGAVKKLRNSLPLRKELDRLKNELSELLQLSDIRY